MEGDRPCINVMCVNNMQIHYCEIAGGPAIGGIGLDSASAYVANTSISNCGRAITVIYNSLLTARGVGGAGNQIGYSAHSSILNITGSSLQATTLTEKRNGGIIYSRRNLGVAHTCDRTVKGMDQIQFQNRAGDGMRYASHPPLCFAQQAFAGFKSCSTAFFRVSSFSALLENMT